MNTRFPSLMDFLARLTPTRLRSSLSLLTNIGSCEFCRHVWDFVVFVHGPSERREQSEILGHALATKILHGDCVVQVRHVECHTPAHMCGWTLLSSVFQRFGTLMPLPQTEVLATLRMHELAPWFQWIQQNAAAQWRSNDQHLVNFAAQLLVLHFHEIVQNRIPRDFAAGGAVTPKNCQMPPQRRQVLQSILLPSTIHGRGPRALHRSGKTSSFPRVTHFWMKRAISWPNCTDFKPPTSRVASS